MTKINDSIERDTNGFLKIDTVLASAGVLEYPDGKGGILRGFMPPDEVENALSSFVGLPVTNEHPKSKEVTPENYKDESVGYVDQTGLRFEYGKIKGSTVICAADAIKDVAKGKIDVSLGYRERKDFTPGVFVDEYNVMGQGANKRYEYDFIKRNIGINHLALCDSGRSKAAQLIIDSADSDYTYKRTLSLDSSDFNEYVPEPNPIKNIMDKNLVQVIINDSVVEVTADSAQNLKDFKKETNDAMKKASDMQMRYDSLEKRFNKLESDKKEMEEKVSANDSLMGELEALRALNTTPAAVATDSDMIATEAIARLETWKSLSALSNDSIDFDAAKTPLEQKRDFIAANFELSTVADASESYLDGMLQVLRNTPKSSAKTVANFVSNTSNDSAAAPAQTSSIATDSYEDGSFGIKLG